MKSIDWLHYQIEETRSALLFVEAVLSQEVLLSMACHLCGSPRVDKIPRDASPISFAKLLESHKKLPVLILTP